MKKLSVMAVSALVAVALQMSCSAASVLFNIPTVLGVDEYAHQNGRTVEEVLQTVETSAKEQLSGEKPATPVAPTVPEVKPNNTPAVTNPNTDTTVSGESVEVMLVNGIPMIFIK